MTMEQKHLVIGGFVLLIGIFLAGVVFSPSGFVPFEQKSTMGYACTELNTRYVRCSDNINYWVNNAWGSDDVCTNARHPDTGWSCMEYGCSCKRIPE